MKNTLKLPLSFDSDFDLVDADGAAVFLLGANVIQYGPDLAAEITKRVNNHDQLVEALKEVTATLAWLAHGECRAVNNRPILSSNHAQEKARNLLDELNAGKGGE